MDELVKRLRELKELYRAFSPGGCRWMTAAAMGNECTCPLCVIDKAADALERLQASLDEARRENAVIRESHREVNARLDRCVNDILDLRPNAERYIYLRDNVEMPLSRPDLCGLTASQFDSAIDAARQGGGP